MMKDENKITNDVIILDSPNGLTAAVSAEERGVAIILMIVVGLLLLSVALFSGEGIG